MISLIAFPNYDSQNNVLNITYHSVNTILYKFELLQQIKLMYNITTFTQH